MKRLLLVAAAGVITVLGATAGVLIAPANAGDGPLPPALQEVTGGGTMGVHVIHPALMADPAVEPLRPEILVYLPNDKGKLKLVAVEYFRRAADQSPPINDSDRPSLFGIPFDGPMPEHAPGMGWHYDLHAWVAEANPSGVFAAFNPAISCP